MNGADTQSWHELEFPLDAGETAEAEIDYVPYGTRTLKIKVVKVGPVRETLVLRSRHLPEGFGKSRYYSHEEGGTDFRLSWGGGHEQGACLRGADVVKQVAGKDVSIPVEVCRPLAAHEKTSYVYLNLTHLGGSVGEPRTLLLGAWPESGNSSPGEPVYALRLKLNPPQVADPVRLVADGEEGSYRFQGGQVPAYLPRWWSPQAVSYPADTPALPDLRLQVGREAANVFFSGDEDPIARVRDLVPGEISGQYRDWRAELYHLKDQFFVLRLWFFWLWQPERGVLEKALNSLFGAGGAILDTEIAFEEIPDAERLDFVFDAETKRVRYVATDAHWREVWAQPVKNQIPEAQIGMWSPTVWAAMLSITDAGEKARYSKWLGTFDAVKKELKRRDKGAVAPHKPSDAIYQSLPAGFNRGKTLAPGAVPHVPILNYCEEPPLELVSSDPRDG
jgi:hypothetical protein